MSIKMATWKPDPNPLRGQDGIIDYLKRTYPGQTFTTQIDLRTKKLILLDFPTLTDPEITNLIDDLKILFPEAF